MQFFTKGNSTKTQHLILTQKQFHCDRQCTPTPNKVDVFGTGKTLPGRGDLNQAVTGPCRTQLSAALGSSGMKLPELHSILARTRPSKCGTS